MKAKTRHIAMVMELLEANNFPSHWNRDYREKLNVPRFLDFEEWVRDLTMVEAKEIMFKLRCLPTNTLFMQVR